MARRTLKATVEAYPDAAPVQPGVRRELAVRRLLDKYGDPLDFLAKAAREGDLKAAAAILPYIYPALKAVELTGPAGGSVQVTVNTLPPM